MFSCRTRSFCPSCHSKRLEQWGEWMREELLLSVPHRQVVFTIPKMLRIFFKYKRGLLGELCLCALRSLGRYLTIVSASQLTPGVIAAIQTFGDRINFPPLHFLVTEGGVDKTGPSIRSPALTTPDWLSFLPARSFAFLSTKSFSAPNGPNAVFPGGTQALMSTAGRQIHDSSSFIPGTPLPR